MTATPPSTSPAAPPTDTAAPAAVVSPAELETQAARAAFSDPSAFEILHALGKTHSPRWRQWYGVTARPSPTDRPHAALALGSLNTELFLAALARDAQQASNLLQDIEALERTLGILDKLRPRHARLKALADGGEWDAVRREAEALGQEQTATLIEQRDPDLSVLVPLGMWFRALHLDAAVIASDEASELTPNALNPDLLAWTERRLDGLGRSTAGDKSVVKCRRAVDLLKKWTSTPVSERRRTSTAETLGDVVTYFHVP